jgi:hypothetical protein
MLQGSSIAPFARGANRLNKNRSRGGRLLPPFFKRKVSVRGSTPSPHKGQMRRTTKTCRPYTPWWARVRYLPDNPCCSFPGCRRSFLKISLLPPSPPAGHRDIQKYVYNPRDTSRPGFPCSPVPREKRGMEMQAFQVQPAPALALPAELPVREKPQQPEPPLLYPPRDRPVSAREKPQHPKPLPVVSIDCTRSPRRRQQQRPLSREN